MVEVASEIQSEEALFGALKKEAEESGLWEPGIPAADQSPSPDSERTQEPFFQDEQPFTRSSLWLYGTSDLMQSVLLAKADMGATIGRFQNRSTRVDPEHADQIFWITRQARDRLRRKNVIRAKARKEQLTTAFDLS